MSFQAEIHSYKPNLQLNFKVKMMFFYECQQQKIKIKTEKWKWQSLKKPFACRQQIPDINFDINSNLLPVQPGIQHRQ